MNSLIIQTSGTFSKMGVLLGMPIRRDITGNPLAVTKVAELMYELPLPGHGTCRDICGTCPGGHTVTGHRDTHSLECVPFVPVSRPIPGGQREEQKEMENDLAERIKRLIGAAGEIRPGSVIHVSVAHDDGCPALKTHCLEDCTCLPQLQRMEQE
jgi:hypothetical protein